MGKGKFIDIEKVIAEKNPAVLKWMPSVILNYLKNVMHQDEMNDFLELHKDKQDEVFCQAVVDYMNLTVEVVGLEKIPKDERIVLVMNHPLGGMDAMILITALNERRNDLKFIVNDILMNLTSMSGMFVGVNKIGNQMSGTRQRIYELFESDSCVCVFPAGLVSRRVNGVIQDLEWKKTFVTNAKKFDRKVIPIHIEGHLSNFFYNLSNLRTKLGVKANIEMLYLSNEMFKQSGRHIKFIVGDAIDPAILYNTEKTEHDIAQEIRGMVYDLAK
ncbi:MAG: 1-acyl-sn-glycerol-3-phosphate acyltransferase [Crocinitomicaceae bacterium]|nr:1-acyl-sn-glycerol-3-phosphate acyltransferase [Flavobacteriales bacterium]NQZ35310.1 1-acyl-sn-glycerol-3-phosphate acyltransferase [Crocinitomicaceae bacterium]